MNSNKANVSGNPLVSVVMATYNGERFIAEAIQSVLDQTFTDFEFIIVDDGSIDTTASIIASFNDPRILYLIKETNTGIADSLNLGINQAKGQYIARMDDDDVCMPERFEHQVKFLELNSDIIVCATPVKYDKYLPRELKAETHEYLKMAMLFSNPIVHPSVMIRKHVLSHYKYNPLKVPSEDYDLWSRLIWEGQFYKLKEPLLFYRSRKESETSKRRKEQLLLNVSIAEYMFDRTGFKKWLKPNEHLKILASHDYSISGRQLRRLIKWQKQLKTVNKDVGIFSNDTFKDIIDINLNNYLISFFINHKFRHKLIPFLHLNLFYKWFILNYYFNKFLN